MKIYKPFTFITILLFLGITTSCNIPLKKTQSSEMVLTSAVETVNAQLTQLPTKLTVTNSPTIMPEWMLTPEATKPQPTSTAIPCNWAKFLSENFQDGTQVAAGSSFEKKWLLKNIGTCSWTSGYQLIFDHGDRMDAPDSISFSNFSSSIIKPGEIIEVTVPLKAPDSNGTYQGNFMLRSSDGIMFGVGNKADESFWVKVSVIKYTPTITGTSTATATQTLSVTPSITNTMVPMPDLTITNFTLDKQSYIVGQQVIASVMILNQGSVKAETFTVKWIPDISNSSIEPMHKTVDNLYSQEATVVIFTLQNGYTQAKSSISTKAIADIDNMVIETDETNNDKTLITSCTQ